MKPQSTNLWDKTLERVGEPIVPLRSWPGAVDCRPSVWCVDSTPVDVVDLVKSRSGYQIKNPNFPELLRSSTGIFRQEHQVPVLAYFTKSAKFQYWHISPRALRSSTGIFHQEHQIPVLANFTRSTMVGI